MMLITAENKPAPQKQFTLALVALALFGVIVGIWIGYATPKNNAAAVQQTKQLSTEEKEIARKFWTKAVNDDYKETIRKICAREDIFESEMTYDKIFMEYKIRQGDFWAYYTQRLGEPGRRERAAIYQGMKAAFLEDCIACQVLPSVMPQERLNAAVFKYLDKIAPPQDGADTYKKVLDHYKTVYTRNDRAEAEKSVRAEREDTRTRIKETLNRANVELIRLEKTPLPAPIDTESFKRNSDAREEEKKALRIRIQNLEEQLKGLQN